MARLVVSLLLFSFLCSAKPARAEIDCADAKAIFARIASEPGPSLRPQQIYHEIYGKQNRETIVLIHGLGGSLQTWRKLAAELSDRYRVVIYDQRGHGRTIAEGENYTSTTMAGDLEELMKFLKIERAHIVGHSMGARTAVRYAEQYPARVASVTIEDMHMLGRRTALEDPRPLYRLQEAAREKTYATYAEALKIAEAAFPSYDPRFYREILLPVAGGFKLKIPVNFPTTTLYSTHGLQEDLVSAWKKLKVPLLAIQADPVEGAVLWGKGLASLRETNPAVRVVGFPGIGHSVHNEDPWRYTDLLRRFWGKQEIQEKPLLTAPERR